MKKLFICGAVLASVLIGAPTTEAKPKRDRDRHEHWDRHDRHDRHDRDRHRWGHHKTQTLYFIEDNRPVRRVVYINPGGGYYRMIGGRRVIVRDRHYTSYPSRYYYPDGRRRAGIRISF